MLTDKNFSGKLHVLPGIDNLQACYTKVTIQQLISLRCIYRKIYLEKTYH